MRSFLSNPITTHHLVDSNFLASLIILHPKAKKGECFCYSPFNKNTDLNLFKVERQYYFV
jgi:hypothetical protein